MNEILLIEDNPGDILLTREALDLLSFPYNLRVVEDGIEAMEYLRNQGKYKAAQRPDLILLDLNLPKKDGREVLEEIKADKSLKVIPVIVLTNSKSEEDVIKAYNSNANCYLSKPVELDKYFEIIKLIKEFWLDLVRLPE